MANQVTVSRTEQTVHVLEVGENLQVTRSKALVCPTVWQAQDLERILATGIENVGRTFDECVKFAHDNQRAKVG